MIYNSVSPFSFESKLPPPRPPGGGGNSDASVCISVRGASRLTKDLVSVHHSVHSPF